MGQLFRNIICKTLVSLKNLSLEKNNRAIALKVTSNCFHMLNPSYTCIFHTSSLCLRMRKESINPLLSCGFSVSSSSEINFVISALLSRAFLMTILLLVRNGPNHGNVLKSYKQTIRGKTESICKKCKEEAFVNDFLSPL